MTLVPAPECKVNLFHPLQIVTHIILRLHDRPSYNMLIPSLLIRLNVKNFQQNDNHIGHRNRLI